MGIQLQQLLEKCLKDWKKISRLDYCLIGENNGVFVTTADRALPSPEKIEEFRSGSALCMANSTFCLYKISAGSGSLSPDILIVWGKGEEAATIGELAVCQVESLMEACSEKQDKNTFMQSVLLGSLTPVEIFNRAKKLHISTSARRAIFLVETRQSRDENALATIRNIFSARTKDFITSIDDKGIIIIRELQSTEGYEDLSEIAHILVAMLNTEAMTSAWVSYSRIAEDLPHLTEAFREARVALEVGKIFYAQKNVFSYNHLGIGRLIYELPVSVCEMFINEIFRDETLDSIDEETLSTIRIFFQNNLNLSETSRQLYVHRNTLVYRFEKLQKKFGLDIRAFEDALTFKLAMMVSDYIRHSERKEV